MIKLNSIDSAVYDSNSAEFKNCVERDRAHIVTCGRLLMRERLGRDEKSLLTLSGKSGDFQPMLNDGEDEHSYSVVNRNYQKKLLMFCADRACTQTGEVAPADMEDFRRNQRKFFSNGTFLATLAGIVAETLTPMLPTVLSTGAGWLAETVTVPVGKTKELDIMSNDIFMFEDDSWGASRSKPVNTLYSKTVTLNPTLRTARASMKWYQFVGNDADFGRLYNAIAAGMYSKITAMWVKCLKAASADKTIVPDNLSFTNTSANWVTAADRVSNVNGIRYRSVIGVGRPNALTKALPSGNVNASTVNLDAALSTMLGVEWARQGYLGEYMGINLYPIDGAIVPGTQNTTITDVVPADKVWLVAAGGYKPVYVGIEESAPIMVELSPSQTADGSIDAVVSVALDAKPVIASKFAVINV